MRRCEPTFSVWQASSLHLLDHKRPRNVEEIGCLDRRELLLGWHHHDGTPFAHGTNFTEFYGNGSVGLCRLPIQLLLERFQLTSQSHFPSYSTTASGKQATGVERVLECLNNAGRH